MSYMIVYYDVLFFCMSLVVYEYLVLGDFDKVVRLFFVLDVFDWDICEIILKVIMYVNYN